MNGTVFLTTPLSPLILLRCFCTLHDTAYVLFYKRVEAFDLLLDDDPGSPAGSAGVNHAQVTLRSELRKIVDTDNTQYVQVSDNTVCAGQ